MLHLPLPVQVQHHPPTEDGVVRRALGWLRGWLARRQGRYVPREPPHEGWHGSGGHAGHQRGWRAEQYAARRLWSMGYHVLERNVQVGPREIDIIAQEGDTLVFLEVRSGRDDPHLPPRASIDAEKRESMLAAGEGYVKRRGLGEVKRRWDVAEVLLDEAGRPRSLRLFRGAL